jgi:protoporphyrinogen oxidase
LPDSNKREIAIIIGAGPGGLTAAYELLKSTSIQPIVLEKSDYLGGLARTVNYKGNRIDIGGHRFFSKSDRVMDWWLEIMPLASSEQDEHSLAYQGANRFISNKVGGPDPETTDRVMLVRNRKSRIYFMRKFFDYPISLSLTTITNLGILRTMKVGLSYLKATLFPIKPEHNLAEFFTNRFGKELYLTFFKSYTEKVWGVPCAKISASWGAQRIKGLSLSKAVANFVKKLLPRTGDVRQKDTETSLIERFLYPKYGPGQMWEIVTGEIIKGGGEVIMDSAVSEITTDGHKILSVTITNSKTAEKKEFFGDYFFSTMPIKDLVQAIKSPVPPAVKEISDGLVYRDFITVGLLVNKLAIEEQTEHGKKLISDNWIYIQEPDVKLGRLQIFNNWSPYMVADPSKVWLGLEYFCDEIDDFWQWDDPTLVKFAQAELEKIGIIKQTDVLDATVIKMPKTYPGYFGSYDKFDELRKFLDSFVNLFLIGRNGMHKYNNQDHSMLTAMTAVENIANGIKSKDNIWSINTEMEYHEEK